MADAALSIGQSTRPRIKLRHVAAAVLGNALEFYDFTVYTFFAAEIGRAFFPSRSAFVSLIASVSVFGVGFLGRPVGAIVIGAYGDRVGRKPAMLAVFGLMGVALLGLVATPSYAMIGVAAPLLLLAFRLLQGFALGGVVGPATAFLLEAARPERRGLYASLQFASQGVSTLLGGTVGVLLSSILSAQQLETYGWRLAFFVGVAILPFGLVIRRSLPETLHAAAANSERSESWRGHTRTIAAGFAMLAAATVGNYVLLYMTTYASQDLHMRANISFAAPAMFGLANVICSPLSGLVSDRIGRRPIMIGSRALFVLATIPAFMLMVHYRTAPVVLSAVFVLGCLSQCTAPAFVSLTEALPQSIRSASLSITYAFSIAIFGGSTQTIVTWLLHATGDLLAPAYYLTAANIVGVIAMMAMRETAPLALQRLNARTMRKSA